MSAVLPTPIPSPSAHPAPTARASGRWLGRAAVAWFVVAAIGQGLFALYVALFYGGSMLAGEPERWNRVSRHLYNAGDMPGNLAMGAHVLLAVVILLGGVLQLSPALRRAAPQLHRWNGRVYLTTAAVMCVSGLYMVWVRGSVGDTAQHIAISLNALLILLFGGLALREVRAGRLAQHREWAMRLVLAVAGVWFFRITLMAWVIAHRAPVGFDPKTFTGPFLTTLAFAQTLVPLAVLQLYFFAQRSGRPSVQRMTTATLALLTVLTAAGVAGAVLGMWLPHLR